MQTAPIPENEEQRLVSLHNLGLLDTNPEERFDIITRTAVSILHVPISALTLVDEKREWFKSICGLDQKEGDRAISFCGHALLANEVFVIPDTKKDKRFSDNPMVIGKPYIRFYAGTPITNTDGQRIGVFCVKDTKPRAFSKDDEKILKALASWAEGEIKIRNLGLTLREERKIQIGVEEKKKAMLNILEDLKVANDIIELEKVKDDAILASIGDGLVAVDKEGKILTINRAFEDLVGWKEKEVLGKLLVEIVPREDESHNIVPFKERVLTKILSTTTTTSVITDWYYIRKDKTRFPAASIITPFIVEGKIIGAVEVFRDITKEKEVDKVKTEFVSLASHQLRTPLSTVNWYTEMLLAGDVGKITPQQRKYLDEVYRSNQRMVALVNALLNVSRLELGTFVVEPEPTDVVKLAQSVIGEQKLQIDEKKLKLNEKYAVNLPKLNVDPKLIRMVVQNLLSNAVKYNPEGGKIELSLTLDNKKKAVLLKVSDIGYGIPKNQQDKIFTKLFRADNVKEKDTEGTGLGLYIVKSIVEQSGEKIWFESEGENKGSTFYVTLPLGGMKKKEGTKQLS